MGHSEPAGGVRPAAKKVRTRPGATEGKGPESMAVGPILCPSSFGSAGDRYRASKWVCV